MACNQQVCKYIYHIVTKFSLSWATGYYKSLFLSHTLNISYYFESSFQEYGIM